MVFVRAREWWYHKVPLPILLALLLFIGTSVSLSRALALIACLIAIVSLVANFGHAINELFDRDEDLKAGKDNAAAIMGPQRVWLISALSALGALGAASLALGLLGFLLTLGELLLPLAYSAPPLRLKSRKWLGIAADAVAAHAYPAVLCLSMALYWSLRGPDAWLTLAVVFWSLTAGVRGILSHQLSTELRDRKSGLRTVVHEYGHERFARFIVYAVAPIEIGLFAAMVLQVEIGAIFLCVVSLYLLCEALKIWMGWRVVIRAPASRSYIPFLNNAFYEVWAPIAAALELASQDPTFIVVLLVYITLFWRRVSREWHGVRRLAREVAYQLGFRPVLLNIRRRLRAVSRLMGKTDRSMVF